jgi:hypothetical protein
MDMSGNPPARRIREEAPDMRLSHAIAMARVICILGIVFVHAWTGRNGHDLQALNHTPQGMLRWALIELMGRSSVPLLSMISGWLVAPSIARRGTRHFLAGKVRTVLAPMVLWNALAIVLVSGAALAGWIYAPRPVSVWWVVNELFCLYTPDDINVQIPFLRDLFVCMLAVPLLVRWPTGRCGRGGAGAGLVAGAGVGAGAAAPLDPAVLCGGHAGAAPWAGGMDGFASAGAGGLALCRHGRRQDLAGGERSWRRAGRSGFSLGYRSGDARGHGDLLLGAGLALAESPIAPLLRRVEPYMFLAFCAHLIMIWLAGPLIGRISGPIGSPLYPLFLLVQPLLVLGIGGFGAGVAAGGACWCVSAQRGTAGRAEAGLIYIVMRYRWAA